MGLKQAYVNADFSSPTLARYTPDTLIEEYQHGIEYVPKKSNVSMGEVQQTHTIHLGTVEYGPYKAHRYEFDIWMGV